MSDQLQLVPTERTEPLARLERFCRALDQALGQAGLGAEEVLGVFCTATMAECVRCGIQVSGEELYAVSQRPSVERANAKIGRLRLGYCAREGCESYQYRLVFLEHPRVDWSQVLLQVERLQTEVKEPGRSWFPIGPLLAGLSASRLGFRVWIVLAAVLLLLVARHWYLGGSIPLIREPENFRVDPSPEETPASSVVSDSSQ